VRSREAAVAIGWLALAGPFLMFPGMAGAGNAEVVAALAIVTLAGAVVLARHFGVVAALTALFVVMVVIGWSRSPGQLASINHFSGIALGLFAMCAVALWCQTRQRLALAAVAIVLFGVAVLTVGFRSTPAIHKRKVFLSDTTAVPPPVVPLPLGGIHSVEVVNPNALSATAMMVLPVAAALAVTASSTTGPVVLRVFGAASALWAAIIVAMMQSRSAWLSALVIGWLWLRTLLGSRRWRVVSVSMLVIGAMVFYAFKDHARSAEIIATLAGRMNVWSDAAEALRTAPWLGIGLDYFRNSGYSMVLWPPNQMVGVPHAHNIFLQTALDLGLVGLAAYLLLIGFVLMRGFEFVRAKLGEGFVRCVGIGATLSLVSVHAYGLLDAVSLGTKLGVFQWLSCGLILGAWRVAHRGEVKLGHDANV
jgi:putative inorganic carbon (hco3(-)) transporter